MRCGRPKWPCASRRYSLYKAADGIGGMPADTIGGFLRELSVIAQGYLEAAVPKPAW